MRTTEALFRRFYPVLTFCSLQFNDQFSTQTDGGILVYYVSASPGDITAFQPVCSLHLSTRCLIDEVI